MLRYAINFYPPKNQIPLIILEKENMKKVVLALSLALIVLFIACEGNQPKPVSESDKSFDSGQVKPSSSTASGETGVTPTSTAPTTVPEPEKPAELVELEKAYEKNTGDEATKKKLVQATYELGRKIEYDNSLPPFVKYRQALKLFRRTLELDANHKEALAEKDQIEGIYRSMNKPIPQ